MSVATARLHYLWEASNSYLTAIMQARLILAKQVRAESHWNPEPCSEHCSMFGFLRTLSGFSVGTLFPAITAATAGHLLLPP